MRESTEEEAGDGHPEVQTRADRNLAEADRSVDGLGQDHTASLQRSGHHRTNVLPLAEGVRRVEVRAGQADEGCGEGKHSAEAAGGRAVAGETGVEGCGLGKLLSPERRRCAVEGAQQHYGMTERHACRLLEQWRGTQR